MIGGTGFYDAGLLEEAAEHIIGTPYGTAVLTTGLYQGVPIAFLARHGAGHAVPPHRVNYRANVWALRQVGVRSLFATASVGSLTGAIPPGSLALCDQFLDFTRGRPATFFDGGPWGVQHADMTEPYCPRLRGALRRAAQDLGMELIPEATYVCTEGPRFETPAEIRAYAKLGGHVVGMTGVPEVVLAREAGICYATVAIAANSAAGLAGRPVSHAEVVQATARLLPQVRRLVLQAAVAVATERCDVCPPGLLPEGGLGRE